MNTIKACLFDLDGVIVDTAKYHYIAWKTLANELGFDFTEADNELLKGVSRMRSLDILLEIGNISLSNEDKLKLAQRKNDNYVSYIKEMGPEEILPGTEVFLQALKDDGVKVALGSASKNAPLILDRLELGHYFDAVIDGNSVSNAKPDPEVFLKGAEVLGFSPENCVVFEDAEAGVEAALAGNMRCIGIGDAEILSKANLVVNGLYEMNLETLYNLS